MKRLLGGREAEPGPRGLWGEEWAVNKNSSAVGPLWTKWQMIDGVVVV